MEIGVKVHRETRKKEVRIEMKWEGHQKTTGNGGCGDKSEEMILRVKKGNLEKKLPRHAAPGYLWVLILGRINFCLQQKKKSQTKQPTTTTKKHIHTKFTV